MTKEELAHLTLKQLAESLKITPDNFRLEDPTISTTIGSFPGPTVIWQFRLIVEDNKSILDPLNSIKTIIVSYNKLARQLTCQIYNREVNNLNHSITPDAAAVIHYYKHLPLICNRTHRQFLSLCKDLTKRRLEKEYIDYLKRLNNIFPATHEDDIFK